MHYNGFSPKRLSPPKNVMSMSRPNVTRSSMRSNLTLDEQSFQSLLSAAFTIQEHNDFLKAHPPASSETDSKLEASVVCSHCGSLKATKDSRCPSCNLGEFRPCERMQRNWASMWLLSQEHELWPDRAHEQDETAKKKAKAASQDQRANRLVRAEDLAPFPPSPSNSSNSLLSWPVVKEIPKELVEETNPKLKGTTQTVPDHVIGKPDFDKAKVDDGFVPASPLGDLHLDASDLDDPILDDPINDEQDHTEPSFQTSKLDSKLDTLETESLETEGEDITGPSDDDAREDFSPADSARTFEPLPLFEGDDSLPIETTDKESNRSLATVLSNLRLKVHTQRANVYLGAAILLAAVVLMWPTATAPQKPSLSAMDRTLIALGLAEAPAPVVHVKGDPTVNVWVDPHTALYYCPGEEQYGKTADGRFGSQRDAQMDRFEPAGRSVCE